MANAFSRRMFAGVVDRRRQRHRAAARDCAEADRNRGGVGERHDHIVGFDLPGVGDHLREDRLHALPLRASAGGDVDLAGRIDAHGRAFERSDAGAFDVAAEAETEIAALRARLALPLAKRRHAADRVERLLQRLRIVAAVVDDRLAVAIGNAEAIGHLGARDHVAHPHVGRIEAKLGGDQVHDPLHGEGRFRPTGAAIGRVRDLGGRGDPRVDGEVVELVRPGQMHRGVVGDARSDRIPGAAIDDEAVAKRQQPAVVVEADLDVVDLVARMARRHEVLVPVLDPAHRPLHGAGEKRNQQFFRIDMALDAEAAADVERDAADARLRQIQNRRSLAAQPVHHLA